MGNKAAQRVKEIVRNTVKERARNLVELFTVSKDEINEVITKI